MHAPWKSILFISNGEMRPGTMGKRASNVHVFMKTRAPLMSAKLMKC